MVGDEADNTKAAHSRLVSDFQRMSRQLLLRTLVDPFFRCALANEVLVFCDLIHEPVEAAVRVINQLGQAVIRSIARRPIVQNALQEVGDTGLVEQAHV